MVRLLYSRPIIIITAYSVTAQTTEYGHVMTLNKTMITNSDYNSQGPKGFVITVCQLDIDLATVKNLNFVARIIIIIIINEAYTPRI